MVHTGYESGSGEYGYGYVIRILDAVHMINGLYGWELWGGVNRSCK